MTALRESFVRDIRWVQVIMLVAWAWGFVAKRIVLGVYGLSSFLSLFLFFVLVAVVVVVVVVRGRVRCLGVQEHLAC